MITPETNSVQGDAVIAPEGQASNFSSRIADLLYRESGLNLGKRLAFEEQIVSAMKAGRSCTQRFRRQKDGSEETFLLSYFPVTVLELLPIDPGDYSRGVEVSEKLVYSVGVGTLENMLRAPFEEIEDDVENDLHFTTVVYLTLVSAVSLLFMIFVFWVSSVYVN